MFKGRIPATSPPAEAGRYGRSLWPSLLAMLQFAEEQAGGFGHRVIQRGEPAAEHRRFERIKNLCTIAARGTGNPAELRLLFQKFYRNRLIRPGFLTFMHIRGTLQKLTDPGLTLDTQLAAVYEGGSLVFRSYQTVPAFLDLSNYFVEATNEDISLIAGHSSLIVEDAEALMAMCDSQVRKKFSVIKLTGILDRVPPRSVVALAREFDIEVALKRPNGVDRFVLPGQKKELKRFLNFLCERYFKGTLTQERCEAGSHRKI